MSIEQQLSRPRLSVKEAAEFVGVPTSTIISWTIRGSRGRVVETMHLGRRKYVFKDSLLAFIEFSNETMDRPLAAP